MVFEKPQSAAAKLYIPMRSHINTSELRIQARRRKYTK